MATTWTNECRHLPVSGARLRANMLRLQSATRKLTKDAGAYDGTSGPQDSVLELGCGTGSTALLLAGNVRSYLATDFASGMIEIAQAKLKVGPDTEDHPQGLRFAVADVFSDKVEPGETGYDAILAYNFLHLVENAEDTLSRIHHLLKPGGLYISKTVCLKRRAWLFAPLVKVMQLVGKAPLSVSFPSTHWKTASGRQGSKSSRQEPILHPTAALSWQGSSDGARRKEASLIFLKSIELARCGDLQMRAVEC